MIPAESCRQKLNAFYASKIFARSFIVESNENKASELLGYAYMVLDFLLIHLEKNI
jgi:hypothetical protein